MALSVEFLWWACQVGVRGPGSPTTRPGTHLQPWLLYVFAAWWERRAHLVERSRYLECGLRQKEVERGGVCCCGLEMASGCGAPEIRRDQDLSSVAFVRWGCQGEQAAPPGFHPRQPKGGASASIRRRIPTSGPTRTPGLIRLPSTFSLSRVSSLHAPNIL